MRLTAYSAIIIAQHGLSIRKPRYEINSIIFIEMKALRAAQLAAIYVGIKIAEAWKNKQCEICVGRRRRLYVLKLIIIIYARSTAKHMRARERRRNRSQVCRVKWQEITWPNIIAY